MRFIACLLAVAFLLSAPAGAQSRGGGDRESDLCKEPVEAAGDAYHLIWAAKRSAIRRWRDRVFEVYGDRFTSYHDARGPEGGGPRVSCDPASVGGGHTIFDLKRCVVVARPCREPY